MDASSLGSGEWSGNWAGRWLKRGRGRGRRLRIAGGQGAAQSIVLNADIN
jgi:hypothetical protein